MDWSSEKREIFRLALQKSYTDYELLEIFVDEKLDESLPDIAEKGELSKVTYKLLKWARSEKRLDELFTKFCEANPRLKDSVIAELQPKPLISRSVNLLEKDWEGLFAMLGSDDFAYVQIAFFQAFQAVYERSFRDIRPDCPFMNNLDDIQNLLTKHDKPVLAVRFVEYAIAELQRSSAGNNRDLSALEQWRDRIAQQYQVPPIAPEPEQTVRQGYLLVACEESGSDVIVYPELHITGEENPIKFGVSPVTCSFEEVPTYLSDWIYQAEKTLDRKQDNEEILIELFLPCALLEEDLATWHVKDKRDNPISLGMHRMFVVRSFDRIGDNDAQQKLERKWQILKECVKAGTACDRLHLQKKYLETKGALKVLLGQKLGLKLVAELPSEHEKRKDLLYEIIDAAVPIALWSPSGDKAIFAELETQMNHLSKESRLTNFADLAGKWRERLANPETEVVKHIRLFCDCPDRLPRGLPNLKNQEDEDAIVA